MTLKEMPAQELKNFYDKTKNEYDNFVSQSLKLDMSRGKPGADQLDLVNDLLSAIDKNSNTTGINGDDYRNYGILDGISEIKKLFAQIFDVDVKNIISGNNSSLTLMFEIINRGFTHGFNGCAPWHTVSDRKFLCIVPGYDRHFAITEYFGFDMINIPMVNGNPDMDKIEELVQSDSSIKGIWCVPKYSNPTGITYSDDTVKRFANLKPLAKDFKIMWDNAYCVHDLEDKTDELLNLYTLAEENGNEDTVFMFTSTSKITFPGSGVCAMVSSENNAKDLKSQFFVQTIGPDKLNQLKHANFLKDLDGVKNIMNLHKTILKPKFDMVCNTLEHQLKDLELAAWNTPRGGYFVSVDVMDGCAKRVVELCKNAGVVLTGAGATFPYYKDPKDSNIRIAPTYPPLDELDTAMKLFCVCVKLAACEKLIK